MARLSVAHFGMIFDSGGIGGYRSNCRVGGEKVWLIHSVTALPASVRVHKTGA